MQQTAASRTVALYPAFKFFSSLTFWIPIWFLLFQSRLSASEAVLLYVIYDIGTTALEVPSGYLSDRFGRRITLILSAIAGLGGMLLIGLGDGFWAFAAGEILIGAGMAFASGTDSALLFESLTVLRRARDVEKEELRAWRWSYAAHALAAATGGYLFVADQGLPFAAAGLALIVAAGIAFRFAEPPQLKSGLPEGGEILRLRSILGALKHPVLIWIFAFSLLLYIFNHVPFVFGQPFIQEALKGIGLEGQAPTISGLVSAAMLFLSVLASLAAPALRTKLGLPTLLLLAMGIQVGLCGVLAWTNGAALIAILLVRMVPMSLTQAFLVARIQPLLSNENRATYLSLQSFCGRLIFAGSLALTSLITNKDGPMPYAEIQVIMLGYLIAGILCLALLAVTAGRLRAQT